MADVNFMLCICVYVCMRVHAHVCDIVVQCACRPGDRRKAVLAKPLRLRLRRKKAFGRKTEIGSATVSSMLGKFKIKQLSSLLAYLLL